MKVIVNAVEKQVEGKSLTYPQIVEMAEYKSEDRFYTITYESSCSQGIVARESCVVVVEGLIINVTDTSNA